MVDLRKTIFISDVHLEEKRPEITAIFLQFLKNCGPFVDALYILGDLFEVWIGDDDDTPIYREVTKALQLATAKGLKIYFLYGNRDFLIGKQFLRETGCKLLPDETIINLYNSTVLIMHGDTLCTRDVAYLKARKKGRSVILQTLFLLLPLRIRKKIANTMRVKSLQHTSSTPLAIMDVTQEEIERIMLKQGVVYLIHGHTHRPQFHEFSLNRSTMTRIVLGAWHERGNMLVWDESGKKTWLEF